jgi:hypothetical protein
MPEKLDRCVKKLIAEGKSKDSAWAMCTASVMKKDSKGGGKKETK